MRNTLLCLVFLAACSRNSGAPDAPGTGDAPPGSGATCGGAAHLPCGSMEYCDYADNGCGTGDATSTCRPRPEVCPAIAGMPTCACDGKVYAGACAAYESGADLDAHGTCAALPGRFACGYDQCSLATQYCRREPHPSGGDGFSCVALPACTGPASCACLAAEQCGNDCAGDASVGLTLTCPPAG